MLKVDEFGWCSTGCLPSSAVCGLSVFFPEEKRPWALGAEATLRSFLANSSFPAFVAWSSVVAAPFSCVLGTSGVSGGDGGTLPAL